MSDSEGSQNQRRDIRSEILRLLRFLRMTDKGGR